MGPDADWARPGAAAVSDLMEAWRAGYAAAVEQVRIGAAFLPAPAATVLRGMAVSLEATRDAMEAKAVATYEEQP